MSSRKERRREALRVRAGYACEYCGITENLAGGLLTEDHILPPDLGGTEDLDNLYWCCFRCNVHKSQRTTALDPRTGMTVPLFNPRLHIWSDHFRWSRDGGRIGGRTAIGRATVEALQFNLPDRVAARQFWARHGVHPRDEPH